MPYILDGDNLVGTTLRRPAEARDREALVAEVSERLRKTRAKVTLFFDGTGKALSLGGLSVRFAGATSADDAILREVSRASRPHETTVVTADRDLARRARDAGAKAISPPDFWKQFGTAETAPQRRPSDEPVDVDDWLDWFSDEANRDE